MLQMEVHTTVYTPDIMIPYMTLPHCFIFFHTSAIRELAPDFGKLHYARYALQCVSAEIPPPALVSVAAKKQAGIHCPSQSTSDATGT